jgi:purine-binding chemotaxis protein CheW
MNSSFPEADAMEGLISMANVRRRLVFRLGKQHYEIESAPVLEVLRVPHITRVPHGPEALSGIANLRGRAIPVLSMSRILNNGSGDTGSAGKIIVYDRGQTVGLLVDDVLRLSADMTAAPLQGLDELLDAAFKVTRRAPVERPDHLNVETGGRPSVQLRSLLSFRVAGQLYGLPLESIREVATFVGDLTIVPKADEALIGLIKIRDSVLPLMSLASLMGLDAHQTVDEGTRIIVVEHEGDLIGLVVDEMEVIRRLPQQAIDAVPAVLQRGRGDAQIEAIGRIADGHRLMSILSPAKLFGHHAVSHAISQNTETRSMEVTRKAEHGVEQFLIFQLGEEDYGLPIGSVDEVIRVPEEVTRMPGAPSFVMGVINLRGKAVALIDQRSRFDTPVSAQTAKARAIVLTIGTLQAGFVVDAVTEVKAVPSADLSAAPEFAAEQTDVFDRIARIESDDRIILLVNPHELLTRAERDVVAMIANENMDGS